MAGRKWRTEMILYIHSNSTFVQKPIPFDRILVLLVIISGYPKNC